MAIMAGPFRVATDKITKSKADACEYDWKTRYNIVIKRGEDYRLTHEMSLRMLRHYGYELDRYL